MKPALLLSLLLFVGPAAADPDTLDYLYTPRIEPDLQSQVTRTSIHARNEEYENAIDASSRLLEDAKIIQPSNAIAYTQLLVNHGILLAAMGQYDEALAILEPGVSTLESQLGPFSEELVSGFMAKALTQMNLGLVAEAEDSLRHAQHIVHRQKGVFAEDQLVMLSYLTTIALRQGKNDEADRQQLFGLKVSEHVHGANSVAILPTLDRLGEYFAARGYTIPLMSENDYRIHYGLSEGMKRYTRHELPAARDNLFGESISMYERALDIVRKNYGNNDLRLIPHLRGLAAARVLQVTSRGRAEDALLEVLEVIQSQPDASLVDRAKAHVELGDFYVITSNDKYKEHYLTAWNMLQENDAARKTADDLFRAPLRLYPRERDVLYIDSFPIAAAGQSELYVNFEFTVTEQGRVSDMVLVASNVPSVEVRHVRRTTHNTRFRPRIEDGQLVATGGQQLYQRFEVLGGSPAADAEVAADEEHGAGSVIAETGCSSGESNKPDRCSDSDSQ